MSCAVPANNPNTTSFRFGVVAIALAMSGAPASAEVEASAQKGAREWAATAHLGLGTPYGLVGLEIERSLNSWLSVDLGGGLGRSGAQAGAHIRGRWNLRPFAIGVGAGPSVGRFSTFGSCFMFFCGGEGERYDWVAWGNAEVFIEKEFDSGFVIRPYLGVGVPLANSSCRYGDEAAFGVPGSSCEPDDDYIHVLPFTGVAIGRRF